MHSGYWKAVECVLGKAGIQITACVTSAHCFVFSSVTIASPLLFTVNKHYLLMSRAHVSAMLNHGLLVVVLAFQGQIDGHVEMKKMMFG